LLLQRLLQSQFQFDESLIFGISFGPALVAFDFVSRWNKLG
jgi:hypothetical protein